MSLVFSYEAVSGAEQGGRPVRGTISAADTREAMQLLQGQGLSVYKLDALDTVSAAASITPSSSRRADPTEVSLCLLQLASLCESGMTIDDAVINVAQGQESSGLRGALEAIYAGLRRGEQLSVTLLPSGLAVRPYVVQLIAAGEASGRLAPSLRSAHEQMERDIGFQKEIVGALTYPLVLVVSGVLAVLTVFIFVLPKFASVISNPKADIPWLAMWILKSGLWITQHLNVILPAFVALAVMFAWSMQSAANRQRAWDALSNIWPFGRWIYHLEVASWSGAMGLMLKNTVPLLEAIELAGSCYRGTSRRMATSTIVRDLRAGKSFAQAMRAHAMLDSVSLNLLAVGEKSGSLPQAIDTLYGMHQDRSRRQSAQMLKLIEPVTILIIAVVLGGIMMSIMLAVTSLSTTI